MTMISPSNAAFVAGASVVGAAHLQQLSSNQDAVKFHIYRYGCVMAVADGVGSDKYSQHGSKAVVQAVHEAFCAYNRRDIPRDKITATISRLYCSMLKERYHACAATTCIFAAHVFNQGLFLGQIGDGIVCGKINGIPFVFNRSSESFTNIVVPLSPMRPSPVWNTKFIPESKLNSLQLMLATDGVSEDILPGRETEFTSYLIDKLFTHGVTDRQKLLVDILNHWETPRSIDDKSIVLYQYTPKKTEGR